MLLTEQDIYHFREGTYFRAYEKLGAHAVRATEGAPDGTRFAVWAPNAAAVTVVGDFNGWNRQRHPLSARADSSGIWEGTVAGVGPGALYKYHIASRQAGSTVDKSDPYAFRTELPPRTASVHGTALARQLCWMRRSGSSVSSLSCAAGTGSR